MTTTAPKTAKDFQRLHHPLAQASKIWEVHANPAPRGTVRYLFTAAQNGTPIQPKVWAAILHMKKHLDAHLSVIELRYKNPTSKWSRSQEDRETWAPEIRPYALNQTMKVNKNLTCVGGIKVVPTAANPLGEFEGFTGAESTIVGHTKYQFKTVPVPGSQMAKLMTTTGACTMANYTNSRAGAKGEFHHTFGVVLVELDKGGVFYLRHINFTDEGVGIDLDIAMYTPDGVFPAPPPEAITLGDTHVKFTDMQVDKANFGPRGMVTLCKPKRIYWEDVCDGHSVNHHDWDDPFIEQANAVSGYDDVKAEVFESVDFVALRTPPFATSYMVPDNHGDFLYAWVKKRDWKKLPTIQRAFYLETAARMHENSVMGPDGAEVPRPWPYWVKRRLAEQWDGLKGRVVVLTGKPGEEGSRIMGVQMDLHGHKGPNGSRGGVKNLARIGTKATTAHGHSPAVEEGHHRVGTNSRLRLKYIDGSPSGWLHANDFLHANGKRQLVIIINGKYRRET